MATSVEILSTGVDVAGSGVEFVACRDETAVERMVSAAR